MPAGRRHCVVFGLAAAAYVGLRLAAFLPATTRTWPDSATYVQAAGHPLFSQDFLAGGRAPGLPLLYKLLPDSDLRRGDGQLAVSIACWLALASAVAWCMRRPGLRPVAFGLVLLVSLSIWITQWDRVILSESLGISLTAALFAAWLALVRAPNGWTVAAVLATTALWAFTRDTNAFLVLLAVPCVLGWIALRGVRPGRVVLAAGLVAIFAASTASQSGPHASWARWEAPLLNVIGVRVLTNPGELHYFRDHGMPLPRPVRVLDGTLLGSRHLSPGTALDRDPRLEGFRDWVRGHGRQTLGTYLMTHPYRAFRPVVEDRGPLFETDPSGYEGEGLRLAGYGAHGVPRLLPAPLATAVYPPTIAALLAWLAVVAAAAILLARRGFARPVWLVPALAVVFQIPHAAIVWNGGPTDIARHAVLVGLMTRLGLLLLTIFLIDAALEARRSP